MKLVLEYIFKWRKEKESCGETMSNWTIDFCISYHFDSLLSTVGYHVAVILRRWTHFIWYQYKSTPVKSIIVEKWKYSASLVSFSLANFLEDMRFQTVNQEQPQPKLVLKNISFPGDVGSQHKVLVWMMDARLGPLLCGFCMCSLWQCRVFFPFRSVEIWDWNRSKSILWLFKCKYIQYDNSAARTWWKKHSGKQVS